MMHVHIFIIIASLAQLIASYKILLVPVDHRGHVNFFSVAAKALQDRGHKVFVLANQRHQKMLENAGVPHLLNPTKRKDMLDDGDAVENAFFSSGLDHVINTLLFTKTVSQGSVETCYEMSGNEQLMETLKSQRFDLAIIDGSDPARSYFIIPYKLDIKYISLSGRHDPWSVRVPAMPSGESYLGVYYMDQHPTFKQRLVNFVLHSVLYLALPPPVFKDYQIGEMAPEKPKSTYRDLYLNSEVFLVNNDNLCVDYPRVEAPHYHLIGGLGARKPSPLPKEFQDFFNEAENGVIVVSFGSLIAKAPEEMMRKLFNVFRKLPQSVVMRYSGTRHDVPANVMLSKWLPQNDLLGQKQTVLFITHGGNNGQMEGLYHGVPMLVMPFALDQQFNADRVVGMKLGKSLPPLSFSETDLYDAILEIVDEPVYNENMKKCAKIKKNFPSTHDQLDFWVKHVMEFGGDHLKPPYMDMPIYQYFMLDVLLFILVCMLIQVFVLWKICIQCKKLCSGGKQKYE